MQNVWRAASTYVAPERFDPAEGVHLLFRPRQPGRSRYMTTRVHRFTSPLLSIVVPAGTLTDLASIPWFLRWAFSTTGRWQRAAVFHDRACDHCETPEDRHIADVIFRSMARLDGVDPLTAWILYVGVRLGAWHWQLTRKAK